MSETWCPEHGDSVPGVCAGCAYEAGRAEVGAEVKHLRSLYKRAAGMALLAAARLADAGIAGWDTTMALVKELEEAAG